MDTPDPTASGPIEVAPGVTLSGAALRWSFARSGGAGGQNVNKVATKAVLRIDLDAFADAMPAWAVDRLKTLAGSQATDDELIITANDSRSQLANRKACLAKLRALVIGALNRPKKRRPTRPSKASIRRRLDAKKQRARLKQTRRPPKGEE